VNQCNCGSYAINNDPDHKLCDCCWRDRKIAEQQAKIDRLQSELDNARGHRIADNAESKAEIDRLKNELHALTMAVRCYRTAHYECWANEDDYYQKMLSLVSEAALTTIEATSAAGGKLADRVQCAYCGCWILRSNSKPDADGQPICVDLCVSGSGCRYMAEIDRLEAIVDKLPKTADGVPVTPGLELWTVHSGTGLPYSITVGSVRYGGIYPDCYSTREAASAAGG